MGSLFSNSQPGYTPTLRQTTQVNVPTSDGQEAQEENVSDDENVRDVIRKTTRARSSTIQTSYRGILGDDGDDFARSNALVPQRKNLLGE